ncbi:MAG TPA: hypothetical protein VFB77_15285 [Acidimicrobiales bacterium]|nr:hypothetical protein [Acidimicrobiales bacterium]
MRSARRARLAALAAGVACALLLALDGPAAAQETTTTEETPTTEAPPTTAPPTTARPTTTAERPTTTETPATTTTTEAEADDEGSDVDWGLIALIGGIALAVIALIALIASAVSRRNKAQGTLNRRIAHLIGGAEWVHDQASLDLAGGTYTPDRLRAAWEDTRRRINDLAVEANTIAADAHDERLRNELGYLGHSLGLLGGALDTSVGLRLQEGGQDPGRAMASSEAVDVVNQRRHELRAAIAPLAARV